MTEFADAAPAAADSAPASVPANEAVIESVVGAPSPLSNQGSTPEAPVAPAKRDSLETIIERASAKVEAENKAPDPAADKGAKVEAKAPPAKDVAKPEPAKPADNRAPDGKFLAKVPADATAQPVQPAPVAPAAVESPKSAAPATDAPARFSPDAKAAWTTTPDAVRAETQRAIREMEGGIEKHRAAAEAFEPVRKFHEMAKSGGTTLDAALDKYVNMENAWRGDPAAGFVAVCRNLGVDPVQQAQAIVERLSGAQNLPKGDSPETAALKQQLVAQQQRLDRLEQQTQEAAAAPVVKTVGDFFREHPIAEYIHADMAEAIKAMQAQGQQPDLQQAYDIAIQKHPHLALVAKPAPIPAVAAEPNPAPPLAAAAHQDLTAQTLKGSKSIGGSPSSGSDPNKRKPSPSADDAVRRAFECYGS